MPNVLDDLTYYTNCAQKIKLKKVEKSKNQSQGLGHTGCFRVLLELYELLKILFFI